LLPRLCQNVARTRTGANPRFVIPATLSVIPATLSVIPVTLSVIPAEAGIQGWRGGETLL